MRYRGAFGAVLVGSVFAVWAASAAGAPSATLHLRIKPRTPRVGHHFSLFVSGRYERAAIPPGDVPELLIFEYPGPCKATAQAEFRAYGYTPNIYESPGTPFFYGYRGTAHRASWQRICAYLYPNTVGPTSTLTPIAKASLRWHIVR